MYRMRCNGINNNLGLMERSLEGSGNTNVITPSFLKRTVLFDVGNFLSSGEDSFELRGFSFTVHEMGPLVAITNTGKYLVIFFYFHCILM